MSTPPPEAIALVTRAFAAGIELPKLVRRAGVGRATWWRIRQGGDFHKSTMTRLETTLDAMIEERNPAPDPPTEAAPQQDAAHGG